MTLRSSNVTESTGPQGRITLCGDYRWPGPQMTWPRASYLVGRLPSSRDSASYVWGFWWVARQATHLTSLWSTGHMAAPAVAYASRVPATTLAAISSTRSTRT